MARSTRMMNIIKALVVRLALIFHVLVTVWRVTTDLDDDIYWLMCVIMVPFFIEGAYTIINRSGQDFRMFTPCFFFYLATTIPCVWLLELKKSDNFIDEEKGIKVENKTEEARFGVDINPSTWTVMIEELLLYLLILSRWILPRGRVSREQLSDLLFAFIGIASDIMEMFSIFGIAEVRKNRTLSYFVLSCWSLSLLQFCMTITVIHEPRKGKVIKTIDENKYEEEKPKIWREILAIICSMFMQDIPFVTLRLYTIITYNIITYSLIFFTSKNVLVILLLLYKISVLLQKRYCPEFLFDKDYDEEMVITENHQLKSKKDKFGHIQDVGKSQQDSRKVNKKRDPKYQKKTAKGKINKTPVNHHPPSAADKPYDSEQPSNHVPSKDRTEESPPPSPTPSTPTPPPPPPPQPESPPSTAAPSSTGSNDSPAMPRAQPTQSPAPSESQSPQGDPDTDGDAPSNTAPVSSGYGWVTSRK